MTAIEKNNSQRIAKNTIFLTIRMLIVILISLYTARIIFNALGIEDFGIFSVVGGIIGFLGVFNGSLVSASQRFLSFELGKTGEANFNGVLNSLLLVFIVVVVIAVVIGLSIKGWLIDSVLVFPVEKRETVLWLYYFSLGSFCVNLISIPYMASIVAHEKMDVFAYVGMLEAMLKLCVAWALLYFSGEKLFLYGLLSLMVTIVMVVFYLAYNLLAIRETTPRFYWNNEILKKLYAYTSWSLFGSVTSILNLNGQAVMINTFFGPVANAAKAISDRINSIIVGFSNNFYTAVRPQLVKKYASGDVDGMLRLAYNSTKYSFYIMFIMGFPLIMFMQELLELWLGEKNVTTEMVLFSKLIIGFSLLNTFEQPITVMIQATGSVKKYEIVIGLFTLLLLPLSYLAYRFGAPSYTSIIILILLYAIVQIFRLIIAKSQVNLSYYSYLKIVIFPIFKTLFVILSVNLIASWYIFPHLHFFLSILVCGLISVLNIYTLGMTIEEKDFLFNLIKKRLKK